MKIKDFQQLLEEYIGALGRANSEAAKAYLFLEFVRGVFKGVKLNAGTPEELELEKFIKSNNTILIKGRIDARLGNLIIEFETHLSESKINESTSQLKRYTSILWNNEGTT